MLSRFLFKSSLCRLVFPLRLVPLSCFPSKTVAFSANEAENGVIDQGRSVFFSVLQKFLTCILAFEEFYATPSKLFFSETTVSVEAI